MITPTDEEIALESSPTIDLTTTTISSIIPDEEEKEKQPEGGKYFTCSEKFCRHFMSRIQDIVSEDDLAWSFQTLFHFCLTSWNSPFFLQL